MVFFPNEVNPCFSWLTPKNSGGVFLFRRGPPETLRFVFGSIDALGDLRGLGLHGLRGAAHAGAMGATLGRGGNAQLATRTQFPAPPPKKKNNQTYPPQKMNKWKQIPSPQKFGKNIEGKERQQTTCLFLAIVEVSHYVDA